MHFVNNCDECTICFIPALKEDSNHFEVALNGIEPTSEHIGLEGNSFKRGLIP